MSAAVLGAPLSTDLSPTPTHDPLGIETGSCVVCGHPEDVHELLLTSTISCVICHEPTEPGECFRVRHAEGIRFGACQRDPA